MYDGQSALYRIKSEEEYAASFGVRLSYLMDRMRVAADPTMAKQQRRKPEAANPEATAPQSAGDTTAATLDRDRVAQRAYEIYLARGCQEGQDLDDWLCAERELTGGQAREHERGQNTSGEQREAAEGARDRELLRARDEG